MWIRLKAFASSHSRALFMVFLAVSIVVLGSLRFPASRQFTYRYRHGIALEATGVSVSFVRDGQLARSAAFRYNRGAGRGPASQDHEVRLAPGRYTAVFALEYVDGSRKEFSVPVEIAAFAFAYTLDIGG